MNVLKNSLDEHKAKKMSISQNCVYCPINNKFNDKKIRRTIWVCEKCSFENDKPFYLCQ